MKENLLVANSIELQYGQRKILQDIHLQCKTGQVIGILGLNGSGKSCLLKTIFGSLQPVQRHISLEGKVRRQPLYLKKNAVKYLSQNGYLTVNLKVKQVINYFLRQKQHREKLLNDATLSKVKNTLLHHLSGGEKRYLESMLLLLSEAGFVLLDEPFNKLYPLQIENLKKEIQNRKEKGIIITDHMYHHLWDICDQVYFLKDGNLGKIFNKSDLQSLGYVVKTKDQYIALPVDFSLTQPKSIVNLSSDVMQELEIEMTGANRFSFLKLIDTTLSHGGKMVLQDILRHPRKNEAEIIAIQQATQFIAENPEVFNFNITNAQLMTLEKYLDSNMILETYTSDWQFQMAGIRQLLLNKNDHDVIAYGINAIKDFLQEISSITNFFGGIQLPALIETICHYFNDLCQEPVTKKLLVSEVRFFNILFYDYLLRKSWNQKLKKIIDSFYELDALIAMAQAQKNLRLNYPKFTNSEKLNLQGVFHPALEKPAINNLILDKENIVFLTGPNMAGKTTYLKSVALCVYLAHTGMAIPARSMELSPFDCIFTSLNTSDNIEQGYSYFMNEANQVKKLALLLQEGNRVFAIMDELFRGTNIKDAYAGTKMVIDGLANWNKSNFLVSTHLSELANDFQQLSNIQYKCFEGQLEQQKIKFSYQLKNGVSGQHLGMHILKDLGIDKLLNPDSPINP